MAKESEQSARAEGAPGSEPAPVSSASGAGPASRGDKGSSGTRGSGARRSSHAPAPPSAVPVPPEHAAPATFGSRPPPRARATADARVVAFASPKGGCGKSTLSLNTSLALARRGHNVVLVDGDVNGDVLSALDARSRAKLGLLDVVSGTARADEALLETVLPRLRLMPAVGPRLPDIDALAVDSGGAFAKVFAELAARADVVVVDTPAGMFGVTRAILRAATHVVGVLQAEVLAARSFRRFSEGLESLPETQRPQVAGVVLNMLQARQRASLGVFQDALQALPSDWLFDTTIPRHPAFLEATEHGVPLHQLDEEAPPPVAFLFDNLAGELADRLKLRRSAGRPRRLLI